MTDSPETFEAVEDSHFEESTLGTLRWMARPLVVAGLYLVLFVAILVAYDFDGANPLEIAWFEIALLDFLTIVAIAIVAVVAGPPILRNPGRTRELFQKFSRNSGALLAMVGLALLAFVALVGPVVLGRPRVDPGVAFNPPVGFSVPWWLSTGCAGTETSTHCHGSLHHPLGTDGSGKDVVQLTVDGLRTSFQVGMTAAVIAGGLGTAVGIVAGTFGGRVDDLLMRYVDVQSSIPAFFLYVLLVTLLRADLVLMVVVFGVLSWGGLARLVRSQVKQVDGKQYMQSARAAGAGTLFRMRYHVLPNVSRAVMTSLSTLVPLFVLYEAALSFLGLGDADPRVNSLGSNIADGLDHSFALWWDVWWTALTPAVVLTLLVLCLFLVGDRTENILDPRD